MTQQIPWDTIGFTPARLGEIGMQPTRLFPQPATGTVAAIVTCHNYGRYLRECLTSLADQTHKLATILEVDDASTDNTADVARSFPGVQYMRVEYGDVVLARRDGVKATDSDFIVFVDADNHLPSEYIASGLACFDSPHVAVVYSDLESFGMFSGRTNFPERFDYHAFARQNFVDTNSIVRRSALDVANPWDRCRLEPMPEDYYMYAKLREAGFEFPKQRAVVNYRRHEAQRSRSHCTEFCGARRDIGCRPSSFRRWPR